MQEKNEIFIWTLSKQFQNSALSWEAIKVHIHVALRPNLFWSKMLRVTPTHAVPEPSPMGSTAQVINSTVHVNSSRCVTVIQIRNINKLANMITQGTLRQQQNKNTCLPRNNMKEGTPRPSIATCVQCHSEI